MNNPIPDNYAINLARYDALVEMHPNVERKGKTMPYTSVNGHMFSFLSKEGVFGLRLPKEERERFLEEHQTELAVSYNTVMKEYVSVPDELLANLEEMKGYFEMSYEYVSSLKPKPTTRKKK